MSDDFRKVRLLVCGPRDFFDGEFLSANLEQVLTRFEISVVALINGGATGVDQLAVDWARRNRIPIEYYRAQWDRYGKSAGPMRNERMLQEGKPDFVVAVRREGVWTPGTYHMVGRVVAADIPFVILGVPARISEKLGEA